MSQLQIKHTGSTHWFSSADELERRIKEMDDQIDALAARLRDARTLQLEFKIALADHVLDQEDQKTG